IRRVSAAALQLSHKTPALRRCAFDSPSRGGRAAPRARDEDHGGDLEAVESRSGRSTISFAQRLCK
ncbi:MAG: hypothetical protein AAFZ06_16715, partial [Pseudomonadota bacterium]